MLYVVETAFDVGHNWPKVGRPRSPQRLAAARRYVERDLARAPLFPETARYASAEERLDDVDRRQCDWLRSMRDVEAHRLWGLRRRLASLHVLHRAALAAEWAQTPYPRDSAYLLDWLHHRLAPELGGTGRKRRRRPITPLSARALAAVQLERAATARREGSLRRARAAVEASRNVKTPPLHS